MFLEPLARFGQDSFVSFRALYEMIAIVSSDYSNDARNSAVHLPTHHPKVSESGARARAVITRNLFWGAQ